MAVCVKGAHFPAAIRLTCVRWAVASPLSPRQVEARMPERGVAVEHATVNRWRIQDSPPLAAACHRRQRPVWLSWRRDETSLRVQGQWLSLDRAVEKTGQTSDGLRTEDRDAQAAMASLRGSPSTAVRPMPPPCGAIMRRTAPRA
jgi:putative transposase